MVPIKVRSQKPWMRDKKGKMENLTSVNAEFEEGENANVVIDTDRMSIEDGVKEILMIIK